MKKKLMAASLLLLSLFSVSANAVAAVIPLMMKAMPNVNPSLIELSMTIPSLGIIIFTPLSVPIAEKMGIKKEILLGILLILIAGILPTFVLNIYVNLFARLLMGIGTGMLGAYASTLIVKIYQGKAQQTMLGLASVIQGLAMFFMSYFAGKLMNIHWNYSYLVYLIALPIMLMFWAFVPNKIIEKANEESENNSGNSQANTRSSKHISLSVALFALYFFVFNSCFATITTKFSLLVVQKGYGTAAQASTLTGLMTMAMVLGGFLFIWLQKKVPTYTLAIAAGLLALAYLLLVTTSSMAISTIAMIMAGLTLALGMSSNPVIINHIAQPEAVAFSIAIVGSVANIGTLLVPYTSRLIATVFNNSTPEFAFGFSAIVMFILCIIAIIAGTKAKKSEQAKMKVAGNK